jgi:tetratricopeptide (TPR) repeat protein/peroxiredoxin
MAALYRWRIHFYRLRSLTSGESQPQPERGPNFSRFLDGPACGCYVLLSGDEQRRFALSRRRKNHSSVDLSRRKFLRHLGQGASFAFVPAGLAIPPFASRASIQSSSTPADFHLYPQYRSQREIEAIFRKVRPGFDEFVTEKYEQQIATILRDWSSQLLESPLSTAALANMMSENFSGVSPEATQTQVVRTDSQLHISQLQFADKPTLSKSGFLEKWLTSMRAFSKLLTAEFQVTSIQAGSAPSSSSTDPATLFIRVRYEFVGEGANFFREQRVGNWTLDWELLPNGEFGIRDWKMFDEARSRSFSPIFVDISPLAFAGVSSFSKQFLPGTDYWRTILDGASGIDIYGHNGVSFGDIDGDGFDDLYICQPSGLPNRLYGNRGDGTFEDITESSGVGILENTACALFADIDNDGRQDLIVVRASGPLLFLNDGAGKFRQKPNAFQFANPPQGTFTGAAIADYDRDGWLDIYFCLYSYYQGADQYRYPCPYFDAENGPPNFLMRNRRNGTFADVTRESGLHVNNSRFSFCCGWGDPDNNQWPDLYVVNDFGRKNLYRNNGDGTFTDIAADAGVEDVGAGMSVSWFDYDNDGKSDLYVADMWTAAGNRVSQQQPFQKRANEEARALYRKHAMGNSIFHNRGNGRFEDRSAPSGAGMGRWSWSSDAWDFDHDGFPDVYIANGMVSGPDRNDLNSFFWRQVVANSPSDSKPSHEYEQGWNAINELIRADGTWSGYERNVFYLNNRDGTFSDVSGIAGLDFIEDGRTFALADFDHDGRIEVLLKNRNGPQVRLLKNVMPDLGPAIAFRLQGKKSNRDAIGAFVTLQTDSGQQTLFVQAGSGFLAQHSKELFFGLGKQQGPVKATIHWPSGLQQNLSDLPINHRIWVEEGSPPSRVEPFNLKAEQPAHSLTISAAQPLEFPENAETWLLAPIAAPDFSLTDLNGNKQSLSAYRGKPVLLYFWTATSTRCAQNLRDFRNSPDQHSGATMQVLAMNVDNAEGSEVAAHLELYRSMPFPILRATADVSAVYNLLFRSLFDRHRDIGLPGSFLIDGKGEIVKVYQGFVSREQMQRDAHAIPQTSAERLAKALPFSGVVENYAFGRNYLSYGSIFFERGYLEESEAFFQLALRDDPSSAEAYYGLGSVYLQQQKSDQARKSFERAVQLQPNYPGTLAKAWNNLGILAARAAHTDEAVSNFKQALKLDPDYSVSLNNLGNAYRQQKHWDDAKSAFQRSLELNPADPEANYGMGMVFAQLDQTAQAYEYLQKALAARPAYPEALNNLGILYLRTQRRNEAENSFKESIRVAPSFDQAYLNLSKLYAMEGDTQKARNVLLELLKQRPGHAVAEKELSQLPQ